MPGQPSAAPCCRRTRRARWRRRPGSAAPQRRCEGSAGAASEAAQGSSSARHANAVLRNGGKTRRVTARRRRRRAAAPAGRARTLHRRRAPPDGALPWKRPLLWTGCRRAACSATGATARCLATSPARTPRSVERSGSGRRLRGLPGASLIFRNAALSAAFRDGHARLPADRRAGAAARRERREGGLHPRAPHALPRIQRPGACLPRHLHTPRGTSATQQRRYRCMHRFMPRNAVLCACKTASAVLGLAAAFRHASPGRCSAR